MNTEKHDPLFHIWKETRDALECAKTDYEIARNQKTDAENRFVRCQKAENDAWNALIESRIVVPAKGMVCE